MNSFSFEKIFWEIQIYFNYTIVYAVLARSEFKILFVGNIENN